MMTSMTGFGSARFENEKLVIDVQIKSVNGRFLETRFRMPREYSPLENELKKRLSQKLHRGTIDVNINRFLKASQEAAEIDVDFDLAAGWLKATKSLAERFKLEHRPTVESLSRVPDVIKMQSKDEISKEEKDLLADTLGKALEVCLSERKREGESQFKVFNQLLNSLEDFIESVKSKKASLDKNLQAKLKERLAEIQKEVSVDPSRLAQEALFLLDRADIAEEIARAEAHIKAYRESLKAPSPTGKKLEFYTQELHREVNTMGSKTQSLEVTLDIIEAKTTVERLREQVQNVE